MLDDKQLSIVYSSAPTYIKLGFLSINRQHIPRWCALISFFICQFQTIELLLNNANLFLDKQGNGKNTVVEAYLHLFSFAERFGYINRTPIFIWSILMLAYCLHFIVIFFYLSIKLKKKSPIPGYIQRYWGVITYFHPLIFFYPIHTFSLRAIQAHRLGTFADTITTPTITFLYVNMILNFLLAFGSTRFFNVVIKTQDLLSTKDNSIRTNDILTKTLISILWMFADDSKGMPIFTLIVTLLDCSFRDFTLFYYLPYYSITILKISSFMQGIATTLSLLTLVAKILSYTKLHLDEYFLHIAWIIMIPLGAKLYHSFMKKLFEYIVSADESKIGLHYALHQVILLRDIMKKRTAPNSDTRIFNLHYMLFQAILSQSGDNKKFSSDAGDNSLEVLKATRTYFVQVVQRYPKSHVAKVTLANHYVHKENAYLLANNLIEEVLNDGPNFSVMISLSLIRFKLQRKNFLEYYQKDEESEVQKVNLLHYVQVNTLNDTLKKKIKDQINTQNEFWQNFASNKPDMGILTDLAIQVNQKKKDVEQAWKELDKIRPSTFYSSPLIYGMYISLANNNQVEGEKILEQYHTDVMRTSRLMDLDELDDNTMMAEDTVQISMSGSRTKIGYILDCSNNINEIFGWKKEFIVKQPINIIMPPYYQQKHDKFLTNHYNTGQAKMINKTNILPVLCSDGYLKPSKVHMKMHPFVEQGISYISVMRTLKEPRRMVLVRRDGTIDGMSKNFAVDLNLHAKDQAKNLNIFSVCPEFRSVNAAFNCQAFKVIEVSYPPSQVQIQSQTNSSFRGNIINNRSDKHLALDVAGDMAFLSDNDFGSSNYYLSKNGNKSSHSESSGAGIADTKIQTIVDSFTTGSKLAFYPQMTKIINGNKVKLLPRNRHQHLNPIYYYVQVVTRIHGKDFIKVITLDRIIDDEDSSSNELIISKEHQFQNVDCYAKDQQQSSPIKGDMTTARLSSSRPLVSPPSMKESEISRGMTIPEESIDHQKMDSLGFNFIKTQDQSKSLRKSISITLSKKEQKDDAKTSPKLKKPRLANIISQLLESTRKGQNIFEHKSQSITEEGNKTQPGQAENLLRKKLRKLRKRLDKGILEIEREGSVAASTFSKAKKIQGLILKALDTPTYRKSTLLFCAGFFLFNLIILVLQTLESTNILSTVNNITSKTDVFKNGIFRLDAFLNLGLYARIWYEAIKPETTQIINSTYGASLAEDILIYSSDAYNYNTLLVNQVSEIDSKYQREFYEKDIRLFNTIDRTPTLIGNYSNFEATAMMINRANLVLSEQSASNFTSTNLENLGFIVYNIYDDFLISSEDSTALLTADLEDTLKKVDRETLIIYLMIVFINFVFLAIVLRYFFTIHKESHRFSNLFFRLSLKEAQETNSILQNYIRSLDANVHDIEDINEKHELPESAKNEHSSGKVKFRTPSTTLLLKKHILTFLKLLPVFIVVTAWTLSYYLITKNIMTQIKAQEMQIEYSLMILYRQNLVIAEFIELLSTNGDATIRNAPVETAIFEDLEDLADVGNIISQFMDEQGNLKSDEYKVFFDFPCADFIDYDLAQLESLFSNCINLSDGTGRTSFTKINTLMNSAIADYYNQFQEGNWTSVKIGETLQEVSSNFLSLALVAPALCKILYLTNEIDFVTQVDHAKSSALLFSVITIIGIAVSAVVVWFFVMKKNRQPGNSL